MNQKEAQEKIQSVMNADPEIIISKAIAFRPATAQIVEAVRKATGPLAGVAAIALKDALRGTDNEDTINNMIRFAQQIA